MIDPAEITTTRVGQLPEQPFRLTDKIPHEIGSDLTQGTVQQLAEVISDFIGTASGLAFNPTTVSDGGTLPATTSNEWLLLGQGAFHNVGGGADIITTEELNAVTSNGSYWSLSVEIPINVELAGITQQIRSGFTNTTPSEDKLYSEFSLYTKTSDLQPQLPVTNISYPRLTIAQQAFNIPAGTMAKWAMVNGSMWYLSDPNIVAEPNIFTQSSNIVTFKTIRPINNLIIIFYQ